MSARQRFLQKTLMLFLLLVVVGSTLRFVSLSRFASASPITNYAGPSLRLPWLSGSYGISQSYNCGDHNYGTKDQYAIDFDFKNVQLTAVFAGIIHIGKFDPNGYGNNLWISNGNWRVIYAHLSSIQVIEGQLVKQGQPIALSGNTGYVIGANGGYHLHFSLRYGGTDKYDGQSVKPEPMSGYTDFGGDNTCNTPSRMYNPGPGGYWIAPTPTDESYWNARTDIVACFTAVDNGNGGLDMSKTGLTLSEDNGKSWRRVPWSTHPTLCRGANQVFTHFLLTKPTLISFDVWSTNKSYQLAPNGIRRICVNGMGCPAKQFAYWDGSSNGKGGSGTGTGNSLGDLSQTQLCSGTNYTGTCVALGIGVYNDVSQQGINWPVLSVYMPTGTRTLFASDQTNQGGTPQVFDVSEPDLKASGRNTTIRSVRVEQKNDTSCTADPGSANGIILYRDSEYRTGGGCKLITGDQNDLGPLTWKGFSSLRFVGSFSLHYKVTLYKDANYANVCGEYWLDQSNLRDCAQVVDSIKVVPFTPPTQAQNIAPIATRDQPGSDAAVDNNLSTEWIAGHGKSIGFTFASPQAIKTIVVFDRAQSPTDNQQINNMMIVLSNGTIINNIDMDSGGRRCAAVAFPTQTVSWVNIVPFDSSGNNGYREIQIWTDTGTAYSTNNCANNITVTPQLGTGPAPVPV